MWRMTLVDWRDWLEVDGRGTWEKQKKRRHQPNPKARATFKKIPGQPLQQNLMWAKHSPQGTAGRCIPVGGDPHWFEAHGSVGYGIGRSRVRVDLLGPAPVWNPILVLQFISKLNSINLKLGLTWGEPLERRRRESRERTTRGAPAESGGVWAEERDTPSKSTMETKQVRSRCQVMMRDSLLSTACVPYAWPLADVQLACFCIR
ncbi:hypothetical protein DFH08DRAFT_808327 [Mycena albidolilacea]|uniref:Uncharacterized protein n=1 Tax=Mycena albidolilacea TaxID=1033008 RepID=A0AAD7ESI3_9AGAR|nr:hypothetical protein DFH08DRAFT_808327 [Mycena albidolilacea]